MVTGCIPRTGLGRTRLGPRLFPSIPQQTWDAGTAPMLGCMACGLSVLIENKRRRGEMALYVAPRALCVASFAPSVYCPHEYAHRYAILDEILPAALFAGARGRTLARWCERAILSLSMGVVTTAVRLLLALLNSGEESEFTHRAFMNRSWYEVSFVAC